MYLYTYSICLNLMDHTFECYDHTRIFEINSIKIMSQYLCSRTSTLKTIVSCSLSPLLCLTHYNTIIITLMCHSFELLFNRLIFCAYFISQSFLSKNMHLGNRLRYLSIAPGREFLDLKLLIDMLISAIAK
ncbi:hypothetical protein O6H91_11G082500 [Diphasiastrum complanatum]|uniref:Uncharacterized protein n=1 Tax=Diphasiastrum complanatum TaxID=34168 RepID=A0ACC2CBJ9_DIPCM|nr:hypothetical protein O6H91_11G082500 [Diphasiastrum complanatum]